MEVDDATQTSPMTPTDNGDDDTGSSYSDEPKEAVSPSDYEDLDDDEKDPEDFRRLWEAEDERPQSGSGSDSHKSESPPPAYSNKPPSRASSNGSHSSSGSSSASGSSSGAESSRAKRLKDLDEIMRQIDEQARRLVEAREKESQGRASPPRATSSPKPGNSSVRERPKVSSPSYVAVGGRDRNSDTEADRLLPRSGFYKQTDAETGQVEDIKIMSPTSPRAEVMYLPNVKPSKHKSYSPLQIQIPNRPQGSKAPSPPKSLSQRGQHNHNQPPPPSKQELYSPRRVSPNGAKKKPAQYASPCDQVESPTSPLSPMSDSKYIPEMPQITPRRVGQNPAFNKGSYSLYQNLPPPVSPRKTLLGHNGRREKSPLSRIDHEKLLARSSPLSSTSSSDNSEIFSQSPHGASPPQKNTQQHSPPNNSLDTLTAIPYRGVKTGDSSLPCSPPTTPRKQAKVDHGIGGSSSSSVGHSPTPRRSNKSTPEPPPRNLAISGNKLTHPLLDGYPFRRNSLTADGGQSTSEGYHSDRADTDIDAIVIREIPIRKKTTNNDGPVSPNHRQSYHEATSPDYVEM